MVYSKYISYLIKLVWFIVFLLIIFIDRSNSIQKISTIVLLLMISIITVIRSLNSRNEWREKLDDRQHFLNNINAGQLYSIAESSRLRSEYEQENNFKYDLVLRYRLDNLQKEGVKLENQIQGVCLY